MTEQELIEQLASKWHDGFQRWIAYLFARSKHNPDGTLTVPSDLAAQWKNHALHSYPQLTDTDRQQLHDEVAHILPIIREYAQSQCGSSGEMAAMSWGAVNAHTACISDLQRQVQILMNEVFCTYADRPATRNQTLLGEVRELRRLVFSYKACGDEAKEYAEGLGQERANDKTEDLKPLLIAVWRHMQDSRRRLDPSAHPNIDPYSAQSTYEPAYINHCFDLTQRVHEATGYTPGEHIEAECPLCSGW